MSKKFCKDEDDLKEKVRGRKKYYICGRCEKKSPKEKWCCKPREIKR
jgi:hypothetical protein